MTTEDPSGFNLLGQQVNIEAAPGSPDEPLIIVFVFDASSLEGADPADVQIFRDGILVADCTGEPFTSENDVCLFSRNVRADGDLELTIRTVHASGWVLGDPLLDFAGFFSPVKNPPNTNSAGAGSRIPVPFSLNGNHGLDILAPGSPTSVQVDCSTHSTIGSAEPTSSVKGLVYNVRKDRYTYDWKTRTEWLGTCRLFNLKLADSTDHQALFKFGKLGL